MKKGFTLIELLAVIVILAIIALIAFPTISGLVEKSKKGGAEQSANGYNDAINKQMALNLMDSNDENDINKGIYDAPFDSKYNLKVKGQAPKKGWVFVNKDGTSVYSYVIGEYVVSYDGTEVTVVKGTEPNPKPSFATDSWEVIINNVRNGNAYIYNLGDTKEVDMGTFGKHTVRIANMSTPSECSIEGFSQTACGFVIEFSDIIANHSMNNTDTNVGGWPVSSMREYINNDIYNSLPIDLKNGIIDTKVISGHGNYKKENGYEKENINFISEDKLYLLSSIEGGEATKSSNYGNYDSSEDNTRILDYYLLHRNSSYWRTKYLNGEKNGWYLRSADYAPGIVERSAFYYFSKDGTSGLISANASNGVSPAFRIG